MEAHNCIFNYDLVSICEINLNDTAELPESVRSYLWNGSVE